MLCVIELSPNAQQAAAQVFDGVALVVAFKDRLSRDARARIVLCANTALKSHTDLAVGLLSALALEFQVTKTYKCLPCDLCYTIGLT